MALRSNFNPQWASMPGNTILDFLTEKQLTKTWLSEKLEWPIHYVEDLLRGDIEIDYKLALKLSKVVGATVEFWVTRETLYREDKRTLEEASWLKKLPVGEMRKFGWISSTENALRECLEFFGVESVNEWNKLYGYSLRKLAFRISDSIETQSSSIVTWIRFGELKAQATNCPAWNELLVLESLDQMRSLTRKKSPSDFLPELKSLCCRCGIVLVIAPTPTGCPASGVAKFVSESKALMLLSFRYRSDDQFWFTFFHEIGHLILHKDTFIEDYAENSNSKQESEANKFAFDILIPVDKQPNLRRLRAQRDIIRYAVDIGISPGIVVGQLQHLQYIPRNYNNGLKRFFTWGSINH